MEAEQTNPQKPKNYKAMPYNPVKKVESEEKLKQLEQTKLEHSYTFWVKIQDQNAIKKKRNDKFEDELKEIDNVSTVSLILRF